MEQTEKRIRVTLHRPPNRHTYCSIFFNPTLQKRVNKSLATRDETEAKQVCLDLERLCNNAEWWSPKHPVLPSLHPRAVKIFFGTDATAPQPYIIQKRGKALRGWPVKFQFSEELANANKRIADLLRENTSQNEELNSLRKEVIHLRRVAGKHVTVTLQEAVEAWKQTYPHGRKPSTVVDAFGSVDSFVESAGGTRHLPSIRVGDIDHWIEHYKHRYTKRKFNKEDVSPMTKKRVRSYVSGFFNWAERKYDLFENPMRKAEPIPGVARTPEQILAIRNPEDLKALIDSLNDWPYWQTLVAVACLAGPRYAELINLRCEDVYLDQGYFRISTITDGATVLKSTKTALERIIPIEQTVLLPILTRYLSSHDRKYPWLFPTTADSRKRKKSIVGQWSSNRAFLDAHRQVMTRAKENSKGAGEFWKYGPAEYRHCFGTALGHCGYSSLEISRLMGNSPRIAERHYIGVLTQDIGKRWPFQWSTSAGTSKNADVPPQNGHQGD